MTRPKAPKIDGAGDLQTYREAAEFLGVKVTTLKGLVAAGEIDRLYIGTGTGRPRIVKASIVAYLDRQYAAEQARAHGSPS